MTTINLSVVRGTKTDADLRDAMRSILRKYGSVTVKEAWSLPTTYFRCRFTAIFDQDLPEHKLIQINQEKYNNEFIRAHRPFCCIPRVPTPPANSTFCYIITVILVGMIFCLILGSVFWVFWSRSQRNEQEKSTSGDVCPVPGSMAFSKKFLDVRTQSLKQCLSIVNNKNGGIKQIQDAKHATVELALQGCLTQWWELTHAEIPVHIFELLHKAMYLDAELSACEQLKADQHPTSSVGHDLKLANVERGIALTADDLKKATQKLLEKRDMCYLSEGLTDAGIKEALELL